MGEIAYMRNIAAVNIRLQYNIQSVIIVYEVEYIIIQF